MLVLSRKTQEAVLIGGNITVKVLSVQRNRVKLGFEAPDGVPVVRTELLGEEPEPSHGSPETNG